jgi:hypothetical protein
MAHSEEMVAPRAREEWLVLRERCSRRKDDDNGFESRGLLQGEGKEPEDAELEPLRVRLSLRQNMVGAVVLVSNSDTGTCWRWDNTLAERITVSVDGRNAVREHDLEV